MSSIDINADIGESFGRYTIGNDQELLKYISSANIACGFHAGDPLVIRNTVINSLKLNVSVGAHPGYPDLQGFGRRAIRMSSEEMVAMIIYQIGALKSIAEAEGGRLNHVKAHGALYNSAANDSNIAEAIAFAISKVDNSLIMFGLPGSCLEKAAEKFNLRFAAEAFADRAYNDDGTLLARNIPGSVITSESECIERVSRMVSDNCVITITGKKIRIRPDTICLHGDNEHVLQFASELIKNLESSGVAIIPVS
ncbi:MAG TPA: 5-oxoprolinase subunit PxpA [Bacteroidales bacterium]|nr:5-oxoprolinase subunit PxpA [Bacteroidales bacterium]